MQRRKPFQTSIALVLGLLCCVLQVQVQAGDETPERIEWKKAPIPLELAVGQEQRIEFPATVKVGVPDVLQSSLRIQSVNGTLYLLAHAPFGEHRLLVRELDSGRIYLFDITASEAGGTRHPIQITVAESNPAGDDDMVSGQPAERGSPGYIELTRFAARQLYAPTRLVKDRPGVIRVPVARDSIDLLRGGAIEATPLVAWRASGLYVTAVKLTNRTDRPQSLDPRALRGQWLAATFQHHRLLPRGDEADTTALYLISSRPFGVSH